MSGIDKDIKTSHNLNALRLRHRNITPERTEKDWRNAHTAKVEQEAQFFEGLKSQLIRFQSMGGAFQQDRMIFDKRRSLDDVLYHSYQGADIMKVGEGIDNAPVVRALINANKLKQDYDDKILSVHSENNFRPGDVFEWMNTGTYWIIYLQELNELAYFRGDIRKCSYQITWLDEEGDQHNSYAAIRGPVETDIEFIQKHQISVDIPNHSLNILMPKNKETLSYFQRYAKFYLQNEECVPSNICWRVEAIDWISMPGVLEINASEYYSNETEDDVENGIAGGLKIQKIELEQGEIEGEGFIKPKREYIYTYTGSSSGTWSFDKKLPLRCEIDGNTIHIKWITSYSGQFTLSFGDTQRTIVVESLF